MIMAFEQKLTHAGAPSLGIQILNRSLTHLVCKIRHQHPCKSFLTLGKISRAYAPISNLLWPIIYES